MLVRALRDFTAAQREAGTEEPIEHVTALGTAYVGWALANPRLYELMFGLSALGIEATEETIAAGADAFAPLHEAVAAAISSGAFRPADPTTVTASLWAQVHGASLLILAGLFPDGADPVLAISAIVDGWRVGPIG